jgi:hypothetical protein
MSAPSIPTSYTHHLRPDKTFDVDTTLDGGVETKMSGGFDAKHSGSLETKVSGKLETDNKMKLTGDPKEPIATLLIGDKDKPVATDSKIELLNLPRFTLQDIKDMMKVRVRIPNYQQVCFKMMGVEFFTICMSGEGQVITEPYVPNAKERCEDNCCEPDTRPFPDNNRKDETGNTFTTGFTGANK